MWPTSVQLTPPGFQPVGAPEREPGPATERQTHGSFLSFDDPDGNGWIVQEISSRLPGRE